MHVTAPAGALLWILASAAIAASAVAVPITPRDTATDALERAAFVALPAVYDVDGKIRIEAVVAGGKRIAVDRSIEIHGTAYGVAPNRVVTALHLVAPPTARVLDELTALDVQGLPRDPATTRIIATAVTQLTLTRAQAEASAVACAGVVPTPIMATVVRTATNPQDDLVLLKINAPDAPTLLLDDGQTADTPIAVIGFGGQQSAIPAIRTGAVKQSAAIATNDAFATITVDVVRGDSGAPAVDDHGHSRGVVLRRETEQTEPVMAQAKSVRKLLEADGATNGETIATTGFRAAMAAFWSRDYVVAADRLAALVPTYADAALVRCEQQQAAALATAGYAISGPSTTRSAILALGAMATLVAALLGILRVRRHPLD